MPVQQLVITRARSVRTLALGATALALVTSLPAFAGPSIDTNNTVNASSLSSGDTPVFNGGTLKIDSNLTLPQNFVLNLVSGTASAGVAASNIVDESGKTATFSGIFSDQSSTQVGSIAFNDSVGGGKATLTAVNTYTGTTSIGSGATLAISGSGNIALSSSVTINGTLDISGTTAGTSVTTIGGAGSVVLGAQTLSITAGNGDFGGVISGTGSLTITSGTQVLAGNNTYTGNTNITSGTLQIGDGAATGMIVGNVADSGTLAFDRSDNITFSGSITGTGGLTQEGSGNLTLTIPETYSGATNIAAGTLTLGPNGTIAASSNVAVGGTFDISGTTGASIKSLSGTGLVNLGAQTLTISAGTGTFSGTVQGTGGVTITGGTQTFNGTQTYTGATLVSGGTLRLGGSVVANNITDNATVSFFSSTPVSVTGVISGSGAVTQTGNGVTTISAVQTYTGPTTISLGTLALSGTGSIARSSNLQDDGIFDISATGGGGATLASLSGSGAVALGSQTLTLANASGNFAGAIGGTGGLTLANGSETLSSVSSFTGQTTISSGTLFLTSTTAVATSARVIANGTLDVSGVTTSSLIASAQISSLSGSGAVVLGTKTLQITNAGDTFSGVISGSGGINVSGGSETLSGTNTYSGATTIGSGGVLKLAGTGSISSASTVTDNGTFDISGITPASASLSALAGSGTVTLGAKNLNLVAGGGSVFSGAIAGTGSLTISGGTQILSGANSYSGGTTITAGTLQLGNANASGSLAGNVVDNGTLAFNRTDTAAFAGVISGTGGVSQMGNGTTALTAANTYTGGTVISAGTLQIGNGSNTGSIVGNVTDNGMLGFNRSDATSFGGNISGTGGVTLIGTGTLTLTGVESYTGVTTISNVSRLVIASGASISTSSDVVDNGVLDLSNLGSPQLSSLGGSGSVLIGANTLGLSAGADTFSGSISGSGGITVSGGNQILSGTNAYTGATTVNGGTLTVNGAITSSSGVTVNSGGTLSGTGTVARTAINSGGTLAPGAGMTIANGLTMASGSNFLATVSSAAVTKLTVNGTAAIGGTLSVSNGGGSWLLGQKQTVLTATNGVSGTFTVAPITSTGAQYASAVSYDANDVFVTVNLSKLSPLLPSGSNANAVAPIAGIDAAIAKGDTVPSGIQNLANLTSAQLGTAAPQLGGEMGADLPQAGAAIMTPFMDAMIDHQIDARAGQRMSLWASGFTGSNLVGGNSTIGSHKFKAHIAGAAVGFDRALSPAFSFGGALAFGSSNFHLTGGDGTGSADTVSGGLYGKLNMGRVAYANFNLALASDTMSTQHTVTVGSTTDTLIGHAKPLVFAGRYEQGLNFGWLSPYAALADTMVRTPDYIETAASGSANTFALHYAARTSNFANLELGMRQRSDTQLGRTWTLVLTDRLAWQHNLSGVWDSQANFASVPDSTFTTLGAQPGKDSGLLSLGAELRDRAGFGMNLHVESQVGRNTQSYAAIGGFDFTW